ncbi:hypothetical protein BBBOND_0201940 [Babesia bigemina]|uniref:Uncharacterized protein n=1 Tax=Babesia bigemina TaxID=5866 RepID=A0A061D4R4_BABBI|nr:hypothetical protein BBBOND_0201940 [Babesia bigemina]CDR95037.1 hypothetical protein BBBOND_0201940 [Babesia bigemina]|eukprot:XP_012767223.1 hypothetical protein BBBOND_0201940 [Babesia bigemina]
MLGLGLGNHPAILAYSNTVWKRGQPKLKTSGVQGDNKTDDSLSLLRVVVESQGLKQSICRLKPYIKCSKQGIILQAMKCRDIHTQHHPLTHQSQTRQCAGFHSNRISQLISTAL